MVQIPFGEFAPDLAPFNPGATEVAKNVLPQADGFAPYPSPSAYTSALAGAPKGSLAVKAPDGTVETFAATTDELYKLNKTTLAFDDVGRASAYTGANADGWDFTGFGDRVIAVNINDDTQYYDIGTSSTFDDLAGSPPKAKGAATVGDFVVLYALSGELNALRWCDINDTETWGLGQGLADKQVFPDGGEVMHVAPFPGGAIVVQQTKIRRMTFLPGDPLVFRFDVIEPERGAVSRHSCVQVGTRVYFLAPDGFYVIGPSSEAQPIGAQKVDRFFLSDADPASIPKIDGAYDPIRRIIVWRYAQTTQSYTDMALCYHWQLNKWSQLAGVTMYGMLKTETANTTLEALDAIYGNLDAIPVSLDSSIFAGGTPVFACFDENLKMAFFQGDNLEATVETADLPLGNGLETFVRSWRPVVDAPTVYGRVATRKGYAGTRTWKSEKAMRASGRVTANARGYLHRFRVRIPEGESWDTVQGIDLVEATPTGSR